MDSQETEIRSALRDHAAEILAWIGWPEPSHAAESIVAFETQVAQLHWRPAESRDSERTYNPMSPEELVQAAPRFPWHSYLSALGLTDQDRIVVGEKSAVLGLATLFSNTPLETVKAWLTFCTVHSASPFLPRRFDEAAFALDRYTTGQKVQRSRWQRAVEQIAGRFSPPGSFADPATMNEALGALYLAQYFQDETRQKATAIVSAVRDAFRLRLERAEWLSPETRTKATDKLDRYEVMVGGPAQPRNYSTLVIRSDDLLGNVVRIQLFARAVKLQDLRRPVDRSRWEMSAYTNDLYNNPVTRVVVVPAGYFFPPMFDPAADPAVNFGAIGAMFGHEFSHGFDDQGRKYDRDGRLTSWWRAEDIAAYEQRADVIRKQYDEFEALPGLNVRGDQTLGENIADLGGVLAAFDAYHASLGGAPAPVIDGLTGDQRFFMSWAQAWANPRTPEALTKYVRTDNHSPPMFRVNGVVRNVDSWYEAVDVKPNDRLFLPPERRACLW